MGRIKKLKNLNSIFQDKAKIIKAKFSITNRTTSSIQIAVLRATTRSTKSPPQDHLISALVSFSHTTRHSAFACVSTIINRLHHHHQPNAYVALKSLITLHYMIIGGSFDLEEQMPCCSTRTTSYGFLNLSRFIDNSDTQSQEFSSWAQWYACFLESRLSTSSVLGCPLSLPKSENDKKKQNLKFSLYTDLFKEIQALVSTIEEICRAPKSLHHQTNDIIYEVVRLVGEDYRKIQYHTMIRLTELSERIHKFTTSELDELTRSLERLESCKARLTELFVNRRRNEPFWDLESVLMTKLRRLKEDRELKPVSRKMIEYHTESTQLNMQLTTASQVWDYYRKNEGNNWSNIDQYNLTMSMATA